MTSTPMAGAAPVATHSLVALLPDGLDAPLIRQRLRAGSPWWPLLGEVRLWETARDAPHEAARPLSAVSPPIRVTLRRGTDGIAELVIVADRSIVPRSALDAVAALVRGGPGSLTGPIGSAARGWPSGPETRVGWGMGDPDQAGLTGTVDLGPVHAGAWAFVVALATVLGRYKSGGIVDIAYAPAADADVRTLRLSLAGRTAGELMTAVPDEGGTSPAAGVVVSEYAAGIRYSPYQRPPLPLSVHLEMASGAIRRGQCRFGLDAVHPAVASGICGQARRLAEDWAAGRTNVAVTDVPLLTPAEADDMRRLGDGGPLKRGPATMTERFRQAVTRHPDAVAVVDHEERWTYRRLDHESDRMAAGLRARGVGPGAMVGICVEPTVALVLCALAVLKAGAAYVPMDARNPAERLRYLADSANVRLVIGAPAGFAADSDVEVVEASELCREPRPGETPATVTALSAAYVIYTSGSSGRPKGVVVPHGNVCALVDATAEDLGLGPDDVWTVFHSSAFDFSVWEIWGCLLTGGRLVMVSYWAKRDPLEFYELVVRERVSVLSQTPSAFSQLAEADERICGPLAVRLVIFGGEPLNVRVLGPWFTRHPPAACRVVNMFGITETTVHVTSQTVTPADAARGSRSVGRPLPGWSVTVRDTAGRILPPGHPGEIVVGGAGVAAGYLGRPDLTAERFVLDEHTGERVYRSGDLGRMRPDGRLDHLGRLDRQVKIRGHRIELEEIRTVLLAHAAVRDVVVVANTVPGRQASDGRIDAYVVMDGRAGTDEVMDDCRRVLPDYMVPVTVTRIASVPITANGKVDEDLLPPPETESDTGADVSVLSVPADTAETADAADALASDLLAIWAEVLNVADIPATGNFFTLGGSSLAVVRVLSRMQDRGLPAVSVRDFYIHSTVSDFVALVRRAATVRQHDGRRPAKS